MAMFTRKYIFQTIILGYPAFSFQGCTPSSPNLSPLFKLIPICFATLQKNSGHLRLDGMHELENAKLNPKVSGAEGGRTHCLKVVGWYYGLLAPKTATSHTEIS